MLPRKQLNWELAPEELHLHVEDAEGPISPANVPWFEGTGPYPPESGYNVSYVRWDLVRAKEAQITHQLTENSKGELWRHREHIARCLQTWADVKAKAGQPVDTTSLSTDLSHSSLFVRLLEGKPLLPEAPPCSYSYPWYSLIEQGQSSTAELYEWTDGTVVINQDVWAVVEKVSEDEYVVEYQKRLRCRIKRVRPDEAFNQWDIVVLPPVEQGSGEP